MRWRILVSLLILSSTVQAQVYQATRPAPTAQPEITLQQTAPAQSTQPAAQPATTAPAAVKPATAGPMLELDQKAINEQLRERNKQLREENIRLHDVNTKLQARIDEFTRRGGSEVRAYCPTGTTSRNTAGASADCAHLGGYTCEEVSGLCRTSCQTTDMCAPGWTCDTGAQQCVNTSGG